LCFQGFFEYMNIYNEKLRLEQRFMNKQIPI